MPWSKLSNLMDRQRLRLGTTREELLVSNNTTIIVPLYIYPAPGAWEPLHACIRKLPSTHFLIIVNPGNGPGPDPIPDENYLSEVPKLTAYSNVDVVGYVHTTFTQRDISAVQKDITTYSNWAVQAQYPGLGVNGVFVDETPNQHDVRAEEYLDELTKFAKNCGGFGGEKLVIHNPGCVPSPAYTALADIVVVFEDTYEVFKSRNENGLFASQHVFGSTASSEKGSAGRDKLAIMIHSIPKDLKTSKFKTFVKEARQTANVMFITDLDVDYYSKWSPNWENWVKMLAIA